jgi:hypothetical protein
MSRQVYHPGLVELLLTLFLLSTQTGHSLKRSQSTLSQTSSSTGSNLGHVAKKANTGTFFLAGRSSGSSSLAIALQASRLTKNRTTFTRGGASSQDKASLQKSIAFSHVVFQPCENSKSNMSGGGLSKLSKASTDSSRRPSTGRPTVPTTKSNSFWSQAIVPSFHKRH